MKREIVSLVLTILLIFCSFQISNANILSSEQTVKSGENVSITISTTNPVQSFKIEVSNLGGLTFQSVSINSAFVGFPNGATISGASTTGGTTLATYVFKAPEVTETQDFYVSFSVSNMGEAEPSGTCTHKVTVQPISQPQPEQGGNTNPDPGDGNETTNPPSSETNKNEIPTESGTPTPPAQTEPEPKSNNNYLKSLKVDKGTLTPAFSREREDYTIEFPEDFDFSTLETINVSANVENSTARLNGTGNITVKEGENIIEVKVTAEDQTVRTYRITFVKPEIITQSDLRLKGLIIKAIDENDKSEDVELEPKFDTEVFNYKLEVKENIEKLQIDAQVERDDIIVAIEGADKLHAGKNLIKITLTSPTDENVKSVYQITVDKERAIVASTNPTEGILSPENRTKVIMGIVLGIIAILGVILVVLLIINHKKSKQQQAGDEDDENYDKINNKKDKKELEEKKQKLFNYEEEKTHLTDKNLEKLSEEYNEITKNEDLGKEVKHQIIGDEIDAKENSKNEKTDEIADNMDFEEENKNSSYDKLAELLERKEYTSSKEEEKTDEQGERTFNKEDFLNDIKNKKGKHF